MRAAMGGSMAEIWLFNYRAWINAGFDSWDSLAHCFHGCPEPYDYEIDDGFDWLS